MGVVDEHRMSTDDFDPATVPRTKWAGALFQVLWRGLSSQPEALVRFISEGEDKFVRAGLTTDIHGLKRADYQKIFRKICRSAEMRKP